MKHGHTQVLLVDDNPADIELTSEFLSRSHCASRIHTARDGDEAIAFLERRGEFARADRPDLIVLDLNLPRKPGHVVLCVVKTDEELQRVPVIIFSTSHAPDDIRRSYQLGANSYVCKPGNLSDFAAAVTAMGNFWFCCASPCSPEAGSASKLAATNDKENA